MFAVLATLWFQDLIDSVTSEDELTWKFSWIRRGVMDLGMAITFLWMWKRMRTCAWMSNKHYILYKSITTLTQVGRRSPHLGGSLFVLLSNGLDVWVIKQWGIFRLSPKFERKLEPWTFSVNKWQSTTSGNGGLPWSVWRTQRTVCSDCNAFGLTVVNQLLLSQIGVTLELKKKKT